jgi:hypothetical protein
MGRKARAKLAMASAVSTTLTHLVSEEEAGGRMRFIIPMIAHNMSG